MDASGGLLVGVLVGYLLAAFVGLLIGAAILMAACGIYNNWIAGNYKRGVPAPSLGGALLITFLHVLVVFVIGFAFSCTSGLALVRLHLNESRTSIIQGLSLLVLLPIYYGVLVALLKSMLPTRWDRAAVVAAITFAIGLVIGAVVIGAFVAIFAAAAHRAL